MAEEFALDLRHRAAIQFDERPAIPCALLVSGPGDQFLAGAAFASDQQGGVSWRNEFDLLQHFAQPATCADDVAEVLFSTELIEQIGVLRLQHTAKLALRTLQVFDVSVRSVPPDNSARFVAKGTARNRNHRYSPSNRRRRASASPGSPAARILFHVSVRLSESSG